MYSWQLSYLINDIYILLLFHILIKKELNNPWIFSWSLKLSYFEYFKSSPYSLYSLSSLISNTYLDFLPFLYTLYFLIFCILSAYSYGSVRDPTFLYSFIFIMYIVNNFISQHIDVKISSLLILFNNFLLWISSILFFIYSSNFSRSVNYFAYEIINLTDIFEIIVLRSQNVQRESRKSCFL